jgi:hypothetical protein
MTYLTVERDRVLTEETVEHVYHHPAPDRFRQEAEAAGFRPQRLDTATFWLLVRTPDVDPSHGRRIPGRICGIIDNGYQ